ncbi:SRPBCC family protein [Methylomagnum ishizawai]|uniref:SRPBCC family protein n=1 Tax=Methylomagnum ishizawai TaxID=1760988 RepID=UPI001C336D58|nr:SRPBCC family protein [Methylomagnum ishizawai]BBL74122.1 MxaD family protein [Methylomagnum ishizawai]
MKKLLSIVAAGSLLWAGLAEAHGPTRQKMVETIEINAAPEAVWALVGDYAHPEKWMPPVESTTTTSGNEKGSVRELHIKSGGTLKEELKDIDAAKMSLKYKAIDPTDPKVLPVNNYASEISVEANGAGGSKVEWKGAYYRWFLNNNPPEGENEEAANSVVGKIYKDSLANLKALVEKK